MPLCSIQSEDLSRTLMASVMDFGLGRSQEPMSRTLSTLSEQLCKSVDTSRTRTASITPQWQTAASRPVHAAASSGLALDLRAHVPG